MERGGSQDGWRPFDSLDPYAAFDGEAATLTFLGIVAGQIGCLFANRDGPLRSRLSLRSNPWILRGLVFEVLLALALVYIAGLNDVFDMTTVHPAWLAILPVGAAIFTAVDIVRRFITSRVRPHPASGTA